MRERYEPKEKRLVVLVQIVYERDDLLDCNVREILEQSREYGEAEIVDFWVEPVE